MATAPPKLDPNPFHHDARLPTSALALLDDLVYRFAVDRKAGYRYIYVALGRGNTAERLGYSLRTISRAITRLKDLGYLKRGPQRCNMNGSWGPMPIVACRKMLYLISDKLKQLKLRGQRPQRRRRRPVRPAVPESRPSTAPLPPGGIMSYALPKTA